VLLGAGAPDAIRMAALAIGAAVIVVAQVLTMRLGAASRSQAVRARSEIRNGVPARRPGTS
jgi:hypothetical protein